jgi:peptidyl-prolyl cis-trans isomerase C
MKVLSVILLACVSIVQAQAPAAPAAAPALPDLPDETVICVFPDDGAKFTMGEFKRIYGALPPNMQEMARRDRAEFLHEYSLMRRLTKMAEEKKLDEESPYREALAFSRLVVLSQAQMVDFNQSSTVQPAEIVSYYDKYKDEKYKQTRIKAVYISFGTAEGKGKKALSEEEAKAKAAKVAAAARAGAEFAKLVRENSEDETSRGKDGDFGTFRASDNIPDAIRAAVFALKQGEISDPVRQPNGFYVFRAEEVTYRALSQVRDEIYSEVKNQHYKETMDRLNTDSKVNNINPAFLGGTQPNPAAR